MPPLSTILLPLLCLVPAIVLVAVIYIRRWFLLRRNERNPLADKLLRPAGESLRLRIEKLDEQLTEMLILVMGSPFAVAVVLLSQPKTNNHALAIEAAILAIGGGIGFVLLIRRLLRIAAELRNCKLGYHGELAVAEELNQAMLDGSRVFHDVPMEPYGNIDHVVVSSSGVYAVETKTRRKRSTGTGTRDFEVIFDGKCLQFPHCTDSHGLEQARQQADRLRVLLAKAVGQTVPVFPILTLPGWFVTCRARAEVKVLNPKSIRSVVKGNGSAAISSELMTRITHQLDHKCRDVAL